MAEYDADVIIVGAGGLGGHVAIESLAAGKSVIMIEAGPRIAHWKMIDNWRRSARKINYVDPFGDYPWAPSAGTEGYLNTDTDVKRHPGTMRVVGGTSRHWTGLSWRFLPEDFKLKSLYGVGRDWPIDYYELEPYYTLAEYALGVCGKDDEDYGGQRQGKQYPQRSKPYPVPPEAKPYGVQRLQERLAPQGVDLVHVPTARNSVNYDGRPACIGNNMCEPECPIHAKYSGLMAIEKAEAMGAKVIDRAVVYELKQDGNGKIKSLKYREADGGDKTLTAKTYVLAGHTLETPKLLMMNELATRSGQVGKNLMIHPGAHMMMEIDEEVWWGRGQFSHGASLQNRNVKTRDKVPSFINLMWSPNLSESNADQVLAQGLLGSELDEALRHRLAHNIWFMTLTEDLPEPGNGISLNSNWKDSLGFPGLNYRYQVGDYTEASWEATKNEFAVFLETLNPEADPIVQKWICHDHLMGTTIMGDDPEDSVVDKDMRCHDHENLFCVTLGAYASAGAVNPTLTGYALAIRAGQTIAKEA